MAELEPLSGLCSIGPILHCDILFFYMYEVQQHSIWLHYFCVYQSQQYLVAEFWIVSIFGAHPCLKSNLYSFHFVMVAIFDTIASVWLEDVSVTRKWICTHLSIFPIVSMFEKWSMFGPVKLIFVVWVWVVCLILSVSTQLIFQKVGINLGCLHCL